MTATTERLAGDTGDIIDAEIVSRAAILRQKAAEAAKAGAAASGRAAARGGASLGRRYRRAIVTAPRNLLAYWNDMVGADDIDECEAGKKEQAKASHDRKVVHNRAVVVGATLSAFALATSGWTALAARCDATAFDAAMRDAIAWTVSAVFLAAVLDVAIVIAGKAKVPGVVRAVICTAVGCLILAAGIWHDSPRFSAPGVAAAVVMVLGPWVLLIAATGAASWTVAKGKHKHGWLWPLSLGAVTLTSVIAVLARVIVGVPQWFMGGSVAAAALLWLGIAGRDGDLFGDGDVEVRRVDSPATADASESNVTRALAKAVKVKLDESAQHVAIIGVPATDGPWTVTRFQFTDRVFADLERASQPTPMQVLAGSLRTPEPWVYAERTGDDESQGLLYVARHNPWPTQPTVWPGLQAVEQDVWAPIEYGVDMIKGTPFRMPIAQTSDAGGGSPGSGKTALSRLELCVAAGDQYCEKDIIDLKDDGALSMFQPVCTTYLAGDEDEQIGTLADWLTWVRQEGMPTRKRQLKDLVEAGRAPDAKLTRALSRDPGVDLRVRISTFDEIQDGIAHRKYGKQIAEGLIYMVKQGRSCGWRVKLRSQKWTAASLPTEITSVVPTRFAGHCDDHPTSAAILGSAKLRADKMPPVQGLFYVSASGDGTAFRGTAKVIMHYVDVEHARDYVQRVMAHRGGAPTVAAAPGPEVPEIPRILVEMDRLLSEPTRDGRMLTVEVAAALKAYGIVEVTDADRVGAKSDEQIAQEKVAAMLRPFNVLARPDRANGNRMSYWLTKNHREYGDVGVRAAISRLRSGLPTGLRGGSGRVSTGSPVGSPHRPSLRVV